MKAIVDDFSCKQLELCNSLMEGDQPWTFVVATYFMQQYGNLIASVLRDICSFVEFNNSNPIAYDDQFNVYGNSWLVQDMNVIQSKLSHLSKDDMLCALQSIPSHLRPKYNMRYVRACRSVLSLHISNRILSLMNLSITDFLEIFFSVSPVEFNNDFLFF